MPRIFDTPIVTSDHSIDRVRAAGLPLLLLFTKGIESPSLEQVMKQLARTHAGELLVVKVPTKDAPQATQQYQLNQFPAVVTLRNGQVLTKAEAVSETALSQHAAFLLGKGPRPQPAQKPRPTAGTSNGKPHTVTDATFEQEVLHASQPVLVDFWAPWCGPCRMVAPILEKLAREMSGQLRVAKLDVDQNPATAQRYGVQSIPTMMVVKNGQIVDRWAGALPEPVLLERIKPLLN